MKRDQSEALRSCADSLYEMMIQAVQEINCLRYCCCYSVAQLCLTLCNPTACSTPVFPVLHHLLAQTHVHQVSDAIQPSHPLSSSSPPAFNLSQHQGCLWGCRVRHDWSDLAAAAAAALHTRWPKDWSFSFRISPSSEYPGLISFRMDWLDLLAVQGTLKSLFQHYSSKASILWCSAFFLVQLSPLYMTTG